MICNITKSNSQTLSFSILDYEVIGNKILLYLSDFLTNQEINQLFDIIKCEIDNQNSINVNFLRYGFSIIDNVLLIILVLQTQDTISSHKINTKDLKTQNIYTYKILYYKNNEIVESINLQNQNILFFANSFNNGYNFFIKTDLAINDINFSYGELIINNKHFIFKNIEYKNIIKTINFITKINSLTFFGKEANN